MEQHTERSDKENAMRFNVLDEYSTLVPFGLGVSERNRVVQYPATPAKADKRGAIANCASRLVKILSKSVKACGQITGRETAC
jgi:hypothetical protein